MKFLFKENFAAGSGMNSIFKKLQEFWFAFTKFVDEERDKIRQIQLREEEAQRKMEEEERKRHEKTKELETTVLFVVLIGNSGVLNVQHCLYQVGHCIKKGAIREKKVPE